MLSVGGKGGNTCNKYDSYVLQQITIRAYLMHINYNFSQFSLFCVHHIHMVTHHRQKHIF